ncbi:SUMO-specific isopeptidase USPL1 isoform X2 [Cricetulus griseus]|uniref:SUMO-specific isopeptidase USPL1 isoform X2 n=1 Tax=Cricetulus griseus TaxID=10029 RepID=A0A9J7JQ55_CRIGR|nr:SUMO-specific isopeptidase USPL1 isoform X2 [Cricetulus griseus]XP_027269521.1 SUMO-specific isopeptidase USPL1 isoform X2 [Cricetulus griseus]
MNYDSAKVTTDGQCPACRAKGKLNNLKTYQINFQESIFLCEDLQCIYPLGSESLTNLISPDSGDCHTQNKPQKRKRLETNAKSSPLPVHSKKTRNHVVTDGEQNLNAKYNGKVCGDTSSNLPDNTSHQNHVRAVASSEQNETLEVDTVDTLDVDTVDVSTKEDPATVSVFGVLTQSQGSELEMPSESRCLPFCQTLCVQWRNSQALCWLDCILSALVHLEALRNTVMEVCSREECVFGRLFETYHQADKLLYTHHLHGVTGEDCKQLRSEILAEIETCLNGVRGEIFTKLQPKLRCTLGEMESPVFAFPALLKLEPHVEKLFTYSFSWNFECSNCGHQYQNRCLKSLVTFTNVVPEWHPLNAAHFGPCNSCNSKSQIRKMVLERASPIFMLHFVEGLPRKDLQHYAFHFEDSLYQVTCVIQYQANNHFITWIVEADGSWLECDDLKGSFAKRHVTCEVPASEIHIVVWERKSQVPTEEATCLPCTKPSAQPASGEEQPASPTLCSVGGAATSEPSVAHLTHMPVAPQTLPEVQAVAHGDSVLSGTKGLVEAASVFQVDFKDCLLEDKPVAESAELVRALSLQPQDSLMTSLLSNPYEGKLVTPPVVSTDPEAVPSQAGDTVIPNSVTDAPVPVPVQELKSMVAEKDTQIQLLPLSAERLKPAQPAKSQASNVRKRETAASSKTVMASSLQTQPQKDDQKKAFVGSWVKGLLSRGGSFMPPCVLAQNRAVTDLQPSVKGANNFDGFKTKNVNRKAKRMSRKASKHVDEPTAGSCSPPSGSTATLPHAGGNATSILLKGQESSRATPLSNNLHSSESVISPASCGDAAEDQVHKLRLKLLKKLKAKKKKLAALMSSPNRGTSVSDHSEPVSHCGSPNDCESIEDLLNELQYQIDLADNKSGCTTAPDGTSCNSQSHEEILAELLSPPALSEPSASVESELRYLEVGDSTPAPTEFNAVSQSICLGQDHNYCSPKKNQCEAEVQSLTDSACIRALNLGSPMKTDIFDDFFPTSALNSLANDTLDIPHFDEYLFENC